LIFSITLWSPVRKFFNEIEKDISLKHKIIKSKNYSFFDLEQYKLFVRQLYKSDDISPDKVEKKIKHMIHTKVFVVRSLEVDFKEPRFRTKRITGKPISQTGESLKSLIRNKYKSRVTNYFPDTIIHSCDNKEQTDFTLNLFKELDNAEDCKINLSEFLKKIENVPYFLIKTKESPYSRETFPIVYPIGKDLDVITNSSNHKELMDISLDFAHGYNDAFSIKIIETDNNCRVRFENEGKLHYQIDVTKDLCGKDIVQKCLEHRKKEIFSYYILPPKYEFIFRLYEIEKNPSKKHHLKYCLNHKGDVDKNLLGRNSSLWNKIIKQM